MTTRTLIFKLIVYVPAEQDAPPERKPICESAAPSTFQQMLDCCARGESWQDAMDQNEGAGEKTEDGGGDS
jgi:hypothetical protein